MRCKCGKLLKKKNITGFCRKCYLDYKRRKRIERLKSEKKCIECMSKLNPVIIYPDGLDGPKEIKYLFRCYLCRIKRKEYSKNKVLKTK